MAPRLALPGAPHQRVIQVLWTNDLDGVLWMRDGPLSLLCDDWTSAVVA